MAYPTHSCSAKHISMYGEKNNVDKDLFQLLATELKKLTIKNNSSQKNKSENDGRRTPANTIESVFWTPVLMAFRGHFQSSDVHKTLRGLKNHCALLLKTLILSGASSPVLPCFFGRALTWHMVGFVAKLFHSCL